MHILQWIGRGWVLVMGCSDQHAWLTIRWCLQSTTPSFKCSCRLRENAVVSRGEFCWLIWSVSHSATKNLSSADQFRVDSFSTAPFGLTCSGLLAFLLCDWGMLSSVSLMIYNLDKHQTQGVWEGTHCDLVCSILLSSEWCGFGETRAWSNECLLEDSSSPSRTTSGICRRFGIFSKLQASLFGLDRLCRCYKSVGQLFCRKHVACSGY